MDEDTKKYRVLVNHEEQYSLWDAERAIPVGWSAVGPTGTREECLTFVESVWVDMRPLSVRNIASA